MPTHTLLLVNIGGDIASTAKLNNDMLIQCIPNFSEGRRDDVIQKIVAAIAGAEDVRLVDWSADPDHNRMVVTFIGGPEEITNTALAAAEVAIAEIDISGHEGVHPRLGALDVLPLVPLRDATMADCAQLARDIGRKLTERFDLPIFLYEFAGDEYRALPVVRKRAFTSLNPDYGQTTPHPTAGATVVGARGPLIAYNVVLNVQDTAAAETIARELRQGGAARLKGVRALGLALPSRGMTQVSVNIVSPDSTPIGAVYSYIRSRARDMGIDVFESEIIGAVPGFSAFRQLSDSLQAPNLKPSQVLWENWPK